MGWYDFGPYVPVAEKKAQAELLVERLRRKRPDLRPVRPAGRAIADSFWGKAWCRHLTTYADHENRIGRGRSYVRNSAVCHLEVNTGRIDALVAGSQGQPYEVGIVVRPLSNRCWQAIKKTCAGRVGSLLDLLNGRFPKDVMAVAADPEEGLFPRLGELKFSCSCPDWAQTCKHVAAALYAFGHRLDQEPELLFILRAVDPHELTSLETLGAATARGRAPALADESLPAFSALSWKSKRRRKTVRRSPNRPPPAGRRKSRENAGTSPGRLSPILPGSKAARSLPCEKT